MTGQKVLVLNPPEMIAFQREVQAHPALLKLMEEAGAATFEDCVAHCCAYVGIAIHGVYTGDDLLNLFKILTEKLQDKRQVIIVTSSGDRAEPKVGE